MVLSLCLTPHSPTDIKLRAFRLIFVNIPRARTIPSLRASHAPLLALPGDFLGRVQRSVRALRWRQVAVSAMVVPERHALGTQYSISTDQLSRCSI